MSPPTRPNRRLLVFATPEELYTSVAEHLVDLASRAIERDGQFAVALGGGSTPKRLYETLATAHATAIDWPKLLFFWGDERAVPPSHEDSNFRLAQANLLQPLGISAAQIYRMEGERPDLERAASDYELRLRNALPSNEQGLPILDLVLLGMGPDAHTASLFPETTAIDERERLVVANHVPQLQTDRLTMTFPLINAARTVMFVVTGEGKAKALATVLEGPPNIHRSPSQGITGADGVEWWIDAAAGSKLSGHAS